jgi:hypothetical protein
LPENTPNHKISNIKSPDTISGAEMFKPTKSYEEIAASIDTMPDDSVMPAPVFDILNNTSAEHRRVSPPPLRKIMIGSRRYGYRVGDWRKLIRGEAAAS